MRKTKKSKLLSLILCMSLIISTFAFMPQIAAAETNDEENTTNTAETQAVNYTNVAPFLPAVQGKTVKKAAKAAKKAAVQTQSNDSNPENSLQTNKTVSELDEDGNATLTLEAYATGSSVISTISEEVPTDIILVLDQSGSMKDNMNSYTYTKIDQKTNSNYYDQRNNLYYKDGDSYVKVNVDRTSVGTGEYTYKEPESGSDWWGSYTGYENKRLYDNREQLFIKTGDNQYKRVTVTRDWSGFSRTYTYSVDGMDSETSSGNDTEKREFNGYPFFIGTEKTDYQYTYDFTTSEGLQNITSMGANTDPAPNDENAFYTRVNSGSQQKLAALKTAVENFTDSVYAKAIGADGTPGTADDINHRIAVVGFANSTAGNYNYSNTELFIGSSEYKYGTAAENKYTEAFQNMNTEAGHDNVIASKEALTASGATYIDLGIEMANGIFDANPISSTNDTKRNRVVVVFTDGAPGYDGKWNNKDYGRSGDAEAVANAAIKNAKDTKNTYGATVYTIGIFSGANPDATDNSNKFMNYVSSNYKNAESMTNPGDSTKPADSGYYLSANNAEDLNDIFQKISQEIQTGGTSVTLDKTSVVKDVISDYFELPKNEDGSSIDASDIEVYTADCTGKNDDTGEYTFADKKIYKDANVSLDGKTISVTNFDFADNWVGTVTQNKETKYRGKKLIIEIPIKVRDGFWGGNQVITNGAGSGVFENSEAKESVEDFTSPTLDVPINVPDFTADDKTIYYGNEVGAASSLFNEVTLSEEDAWKDDYVDATYSYPGSISNTDCDEYKATLTLTPNYDGTQTAKSKTATSKVHVLVPQVEYNDSEIYLGETADYDKDNIPSDNVSWVDIKGDTNIPDATGTAPELSFEYSPAEDYFEQDTPVNATVKIGDKDITNIVIFKNGENTHKGDADKEEFTVKVKTCELTITKTGWDKFADEYQSFVFHVKGDNSNRYSEKVDLDVVVHGNGSVTVKNLPIGNYTVTEDEGWSWRYTPTAETKDGNITLTRDSSTGAWTFENTRKIENWLNGSSWCKNIFKTDGIDNSDKTVTKKN